MDSGFCWQLNELAVEPEERIKVNISTHFNSHSSLMMCVHRVLGCSESYPDHCGLVTVDPKKKDLFDMNPEEEFIF